MGSRRATHASIADARATAIADVQSESQNIFVILYYLAKRNGLKNLWSGLSTSIYLVSNPVIQYALYDIIKMKVCKGKQVSGVAAFLIGAFTKAIATVLTYPLQVAQTRLRVVASGEQKTLSQCFVEIYRREGLDGFFKGIGQKLIQTMLNAAFMFSAYEAILRMMRGAMRIVAERGAINMGTVAMAALNSWPGRTRFGPATRRMLLNSTLLRRDMNLASPLKHN